jgi:pimeloyl-ACP methyl ester carboxylesterase
VTARASAAGRSRAAGGADSPGGDRRRRGQALALVAAAATITLVLSGCVSWFRAPEPERTSTPTGEQVDVGLQEFYGQQLVWTGCGTDLQCTTASAPLDWANPSTGEIQLALVRQQATTGNRIGSLLVNPGGPGGSGYDFIRDSIDYATSERLQQHYDIVGFDPRGVGRSSAISCYDDPAELDDYIYGITPGEVGSDAWIAAGAAANAAFGAACLEHTGPLLQFVDTVSAARDLDLLRAVLGDSKLNYLGYSYGTFLGATYAELYPEKTGHLVLDGALDPATSDFDVTLTQAMGFESAFRAYLTDCLDRDECPFTGSVDTALVRTADLLNDLSAEPIPAEDGRLLGASAMFIAIILPLYNRDNWPYLDQLFAEVFEGGTRIAFILADSYNDRNADGSYSTNSTEAFIGINCLDYVSDSSLESMRAEAVVLAERAPLFGPWMSYGGTGCASWPYPGTRERGPIAASGSGEILVIGTTNDPATPYVWAQNMAAQLENGHLITYTGEGHTAYNKSNSCVDDAVDSYFIDDRVPESDPQC